MPPVEDKYVDAQVALGRKTEAALNEGAKMVGILFNFEVDALDDDGSIYRIVKSINPDLIPMKIDIFNDTITNGTDFDLGLYEGLEEGQGGAVIDQDVLASALDMSSAAGRGSPKDGLGAVAIDAIDQRLWELAGDTQENKRVAYDLAFTGVAVGTVTGTISGVAWFLQG